MDYKNSASAAAQSRALDKRKTQITLQILQGDKNPALEALLLDIKADLKHIAPLVRAEREAEGALTPHDRVLRAIFGETK